MRKMDFIKKILLQKEGKITLLILLIFFQISCNNKGVKFLYGLDFNEKRKEVGLNPLAENWICHPPTKSGRIWWTSPTNTNQAIGVAAFSEKVSLLKNDTIICETDVYISSEKYETSYGIENVSLLYTYHFVKDSDFDIGWTYFFRSYLGKYNLNGYITKIQADSILDSWGISYS
jgi:hypothetical protein